MKVRVLLKKRGCEICKNYAGVIEKVNHRIRVENRFRVVDTSDFEEQGIMTSPIIKHLDFDGTPTLFVDGTKVEGMTSPEYALNFLLAYLDEREELLW